MPVSIVVGGQYGSEGKGKTACYLARELNATFAVRCGGSNSGHTVVDNEGKTHIFRHLPTAAILPDVKLALGAGSYIDPEVLFKEIREVQIDKNRLIIDPNAIVITNNYKLQEMEKGCLQDIGSTLSGTGAAVCDRINRNSPIFAYQFKELYDYIQPVAQVLRKSLTHKERIIIEGTQGYGLSLLHSPYYPFVTSRDTSASAFVSEVGLSPLDIDDIVLVIRAFPIRVSGNSGYLPNETSWDVLSQEGGFINPLVEKTSVTKKIRRVARFDPEIVKSAIIVNNPTRIILNHVDYVKNNISIKEAEIFTNSIEELISHPIEFIGMGPNDIRKRNGSSSGFGRYSSRNVFFGANMALYQ